MFMKNWDQRSKSGQSKNPDNGGLDNDIEG